MGNQQKEPLKKLIKFESLAAELAKCEEIGEIQCQVYGHLHRVGYEGIQVCIRKLQSNETPEELALHHLLHPNVLLVPPHINLESIKLPKYQIKKQLLRIIDEISQLGCLIDIGLSYNRVAYSTLIKKWRIKGDIHNSFSNYQSLLKNHESSGIYFSPQLMKALSKDKLYPKIEVKQSDVFIFGIMLLQIIFQQNLQTQVYNYQSYEIKLGPILEKLLGVEETFGKQIYELIVKMLEFDPTKRISFSLLREEVKKINSDEYYLSPAGSRINQLTPPVNTKPKMDSYSPSPQPEPKLSVNDRGRSPGAIRKNLPLTDREAGKNTFSPIKHQSSDIIVLPEDSKFLDINFQQRRRRISNGYKITPNRLKIWQGMQNERPIVEPFGLKIESKIKQNEGNGDERKRTFSKLKSMRF